MPRKYAKKTKKSRRPARKGRYRSRNMLSFHKAPVPNRFATKLRYVSEQNLSINPGVGGTCAAHIVKANGLYDPDYTSSGHQPRGFDQFMAMYSHFVVLGAKITVTFGNPNGYSHEDTMCGIACKAGPSAFTDINSYLEGRNVVSRTLSGAYNGQHNSGNIVLTKTFSTKKFLGRSSLLSDSSLKGDNSTDPSELGYFHIFCAPFGTGDASQTNIWYRVEYLVVFIEPIQPTQS